MTGEIPPHTPAEQRQSKRATKLLARNTKIREAFAERFTKAPRPRKYSREYVIAQLAEEYFLSMDRVEDIIYQKPA